MTTTHGPPHCEQAERLDQRLDQLLLCLPERLVHRDKDDTEQALERENAANPSPLCTRGRHAELE